MTGSWGGGWLGAEPGAIVQSGVCLEGRANRLADGLDVGGERKRSQGNSQVSGLSSRSAELPAAEMSEAVGGVGLDVWGLKCL